MLRSATWLLLAWLTAACAAPAHAPLQQKLDAFCHSQAPGVICVAFHDLESGSWATVEPDRVLHAASTMKVPVMIEVFRRVDAGELSLDQPVQITNGFASIIDGSTFEVTREDDSDTELHDAIGQTRPLGELVARMITRSSNLATNLVIALVDPRCVQGTIESLGTENMQVLRGVQDLKAYRAGMSNTATARDLAVLMSAIANGEAASAESCDRMLGILSAQEFNSMIPAGMPEGTRVAHKTGSITRIHHDAAVVFPADGSPPYVLVVLTAKWDDGEESARVVADVARIVDAHRS